MITNEMLESGERNLQVIPNKKKNLCIHNTVLEKKIVGGFYVTKSGNIILRNYIFWVVSQLTVNSLNDPFTFWKKLLIIYICPQVRTIVFSIAVMQNEF